MPEGNSEKLKEFMETYKIDGFGGFKGMLYNESLDPGDDSFRKLSIRIRGQVLIVLI